MSHKPSQVALILLYNTYMVNILREPRFHISQSQNGHFNSVDIVLVCMSCNIKQLFFFAIRGIPMTWYKIINTYYIHIPKTLTFNCVSTTAWKYSSCPHRKRGKIFRWIKWYFRKTACAFGVHIVCLCRCRLWFINHSVNKYFLLSPLKIFRGIIYSLNTIISPIHAACVEEDPLLV